MRKEEEGGGRRRRDEGGGRRRKEEEGGGRWREGERKHTNPGFRPRRHSPPAGGQTPDPKQGPFSGPVFGLPGVSPNSWVTRQAAQKRGQKTAPV